MGAGSLGSTTGDGFNFISDCRGVPSDASKEAIAALSDEHSASWVTAKELLEFDWTQTSKHVGMVDAVQFEEWDRLKRWDPAPKSYCRDVSGGSVVKITEAQMREKVGARAGMPKLKANLAHHYCRVEWVEQYSDSAGKFWTIIMPKLMKLAREHGEENVRLVFDFDS